MKDKQTDLERRSFLKKGAVAGAVAAILPALGVASEEQDSEIKQDKNEGYRLTPHIKKYYETIDS